MCIIITGSRYIMAINIGNPQPWTQLGVDNGGRISWKCSSRPIWAGHSLRDIEGGAEPSIKLRIIFDHPSGYRPSQSKSRLSVKEGGLEMPLCNYHHYRKSRPCPLPLSTMC